MEIDTIYFKDGEPPVKMKLGRNDLDAMHKLVGGYIEVVHLSEDLILVCNEEGKVHGLPVYHLAQIAPHYWEPISGSFFIVRNGTGDDEGEFTSVKEDDLHDLMELVK